MNQLKIGDKVAVLDEQEEGVVIAVNGNEVTIENSDEIPMTYNVNELIKMNNSNELDSLILSKSKGAIPKEIDVVKKGQKPLFKTDKKAIPALEKDLHIEKLVLKPGRMNTYEILNFQVEEAKRTIENAIRNRNPRLILIHGVGDGVLRAELEFIIKQYEHAWFTDADYSKYGQGAMEIRFKQNKND